MSRRYQVVSGTPLYLNGVFYKIGEPFDLPEGIDAGPNLKPFVEAEAVIEAEPVPAPAEIVVIKHKGKKKNPETMYEATQLSKVVK